MLDGRYIINDSSKQRHYHYEHEQYQLLFPASS